MQVPAHTHSRMDRKTEDRFLLLSAAGGDARAFDTLFIRHRDDLRGFLYQRLRSSEEADDALGLTFLNAWRARASYRGESNGKSWLYTIASRVAIDLLRSRRRRAGERELDPASEELSLVLEADSVDPQEAAVDSAEAAELALRVRRSLDRLDPQERELVALFYYEGHDYDTIGRTLGISRSQVRGRLHRIRGRMRRELLHAERPLLN